MMKNLSSLLDKLTKSVNKDKIIKGTISDVVFLYTKVRLGESQVAIKDGILEVSASSIAKNEIKMREGEILDNLKNNQIFISRVTYR